MGDEKKKRTESQKLADITNEEWNAIKKDEQTPINEALHILGGQQQGYLRGTDFLGYKGGSSGLVLDAYRSEMKNLDKSAKSVLDAKGDKKDDHVLALLESLLKGVKTVTSTTNNKGIKEHFSPFHKRMKTYEEHFTEGAESKDKLEAVYHLLAEHFGIEDKTSRGIAEAIKTAKNEEEVHEILRTLQDSLADAIPGAYGSNKLQAATSKSLAHRRAAIARTYQVIGSEIGHTPGIKTYWRQQPEEAVQQMQELMAKPPSETAIRRMKFQKYEGAKAEYHGLRPKPKK
jgi:hypothetical protein